MMRSKQVLGWLGAASLGCVMVSNMALAGVASGTYITAFGGVVYVPAQAFVDVPAQAFVADVKTRSGGDYGLAMGKRFGHYRAELAVSQVKVKGNTLKLAAEDGPAFPLVDSDVKISDIMANGYVDLQTETIFTPFVFAGLGWAKVDADITFDELQHGGGSSAKVIHWQDDAAKFAYNVGVGVTAAADAQWHFMVRYRYLDAGKATYVVNVNAETPFRASYRDHRLEAGVSWSPAA